MSIGDARFFAGNGSHTLASLAEAAGSTAAKTNLLLTGAAPLHGLSFRPLVAGIRVKLAQERVQSEQRRHRQHATATILQAGAVNHRESIRFDTYLRELRDGLIEEWGSVGMSTSGFVPPPCLYRPM